MNHSLPSSADGLPFELEEQIDRLCDDFEKAWRDGQQPRIEVYLTKLTDDSRTPLLRKLLEVEMELRQNAGEAPTPEKYHQRFPDQAEIINAAFAMLDTHLQRQAQVDDTQPFVGENSSETDGQRGEPSPAKDTVLVPEQIGRFEIQRVLGQGGFGAVYLARDTQLNRPVALKIPRGENFSTPAELHQFVEEARTAAQLNHPGIVTVHDVGQDGDHVFIVQEYIEGQDLADYLNSHTLSAEQTAELIMAVSDAMAFAHQKGFVHRDLKPGNILLDPDAKPRVADFGLAVHESIQRRRRGERSGTPVYMSPEQVRGETHRLDGRSDIWSLGVILYEMLVGRRPFHGETLSELVEEIKHRDPKPPRQIKPELPSELDRICLKCLSKRITDRYSNATDLAEDLRHWLHEQQQGKSTEKTVDKRTKIVPKGLRSFDAQDADFFLELLPGPRDRDGLPESIRFWKTRIEEVDADNTFSVGLIYGPSGCGKSSLVKAGLLPRLASHVTPIYVESTPADTEVRMLKGLRKHVANIPEETSLPELLEGLREGAWTTPDRKILIVLDQFEQWLHANRGQQDPQLLQALRHCDGGKVQCVFLVRDDFWLAASRFMQGLELELVGGKNQALVDLFDPLHARKILAEFGQAFARLPEHLGRPSSEQETFLDRAVEGLSQDGKVICVRLALFADMIKGKPWTPATLKDVGGTAGLGVTFLEETFSAATAPREHQLHQQAARAVLSAMLPEAGTDIKGGRQSYEQLLEATGYADRAKEFDNLIRILDSELRLITPTDPEGSTGGTSPQPEAVAGNKFYQLTHDYLVPSLREWLVRKQKETRRGRAELRLAERSALWNVKPENRHLPSLWEYATIRHWTKVKAWGESQRSMMRQAGRFHLSRLTTAAIVLGLVAAAALWTWNRIYQDQEATRIEGLVGRLVSAEPNQLPDIVKELDANPEAAETFLSPLVSKNVTTLDDKRAQLHARLALVSRDPSLVDPLAEELLTGKVTYVAPIRQQLRPAATVLTEKFRAILRDEKADIQQRFRAALALADYVPASEAASWTEQDLKLVAEQLVASNAEFQPLLRDALRPIRARLRGDLERIFADPQATDGQRLSAANAFADYAASDIAKLSELLTVATPVQYAVLYPIVAASPAPATAEGLAKIAATEPPAELGTVERVLYGQRRANAAITLLRLGEREKVLPVFEWTDDPEALTQFIFRCRPRDVGVDALLDCLRIVSDSQVDGYSRSAQYALLLALGEFTPDEIPEASREGLLKQLADWYRNDPSSSVHGAAGWLLRQWGQVDVVRQVDQTAVPYAADREWYTLAITVTPTAPPKPEEEPGKEDAGSASEAATPAKPTKSEANEAGQTAASSESDAPAKEARAEPPAEPLPTKTFYYTFVVFPAGEYTIGSVDGEPERAKGRELRHGVQLTRPYALLDREITFEELIAFMPKYAGFMPHYDATPADGGFAADWYDSVAFCRWLGQQSGLSEADQAYADPESLDKDAYPREPVPEANWAPRNWPLEQGRRGFRLPTEAEWEGASRAGARTAFGYGSDVSLLGRFGWFQENSGKHVHSPQELRPSVRGSFDLHGNLYEWTHDWYDVFGSNTLTDPLGPREGSYRVLRGGSWSFDAANCRSAHRDTFAPTFRSARNGFRLALRPSGVTPEAASVSGAEP